MGNCDNLANTCRNAAAVWRRLAAEALSDDERREALAFVKLFEQSARDAERFAEEIASVLVASARVR
jgi:hypothetical protein